VRPGYARAVMEVHNASDRLALQGDEIHVWVLKTGRALPFLPEFRKLLSADERSRAGQFVREALALRFITNRGFLRLLLSRYLDRPPAALEFTYETNGKPQLDRTTVPLDFNLSHTDTLSLVAVSAGKRIGVDVEEVKPPSDLPAMAEYVFPPGAAARVAALPERERLCRFFQLWTRLEAVAKATGLGMGALSGLKETDLEGSSPFPLEFAGSRWRVTDIDTTTITVPAWKSLAAVCVEGESCQPLIFPATTDMLQSWIYKEKSEVGRCFTPPGSGAS
jgi:4'-phosphopantetheinyl transferase